MEVEKDSQIIIRRIHELAEETPDMLQYLENQGIIPGVKAVLTDNLAFNQTIELDLGNKNVTIGYPTAKYIYIELVK